MNARETAAHVVHRVERGARSSPTLDRALTTSTLARIDRAFVTDLVYGTVRHLRWLDGRLDERLRDRAALPSEVTTALRIGAYEILVRGTPRPAAVHAWVDVVKRHQPRLAPLVNAVLRRVDGRVVDAAVEEILPADLCSRMRRALAGSAQAAVRAMLEPSPVWFTTFRVDAIARLEAQGCAVEAGPVPATVRAKCPVPIGALEAYADGGVQPQNPVSTWVASLLPVERGDRVIDACSGHGIKAAHLASRGAAVEGWDVSRSAIAGAEANLRRLGLQVTHLRRDATTASDDLAPARHVLVDAPCSGTGTLRGHPEIGLRLTDDAIRAMARTQTAMLEAVAPLVEPGGTLTYAVCALTPDEGPDVAHAFERSHPEFLRRSFDVPFAHVAAAGGTFVLPLDGLDGFYVAQWTRGTSERATGRSAAA